MKSRIYMCLAVIFILLCSCGKGESKKAFLENVPNPETFFTGSECSEYSLEDLNLKGITVDYSGDDIKADYKAYVERCKENEFWTNLIFDGDTSWCYQNKDGTIQVAVNLYEDGNQIDICLRTFDNEDE